MNEDPVTYTGGLNFGDLPGWNDNKIVANGGKKHLNV